MRREYDCLRTDVVDEIELIEKAVEIIGVMKEKLDPAAVSNEQKAAVGTYLMNFYTGVENIIKRISKEYYQNMPRGASWHKELLDMSYNPPGNKIPIFSKCIKDRLNPYRAFKHLFVSGYGFKLEWELMSQLVNSIHQLWADIKKSVSEFFDRI